MHDEQAETGLETYYHKKAHKFASESRTFYSSVLACSQCRSGEIIGRREQLQRGDRERGERGRGTGSTWSHRLSSHWSTGAFIIALATTYGNTSKRDCGHTCFWSPSENLCVKKDEQIWGTLHRIQRRRRYREREREREWHPKRHPVGEPWLMCTDCQYAFYRAICQKSHLIGITSRFTAPEVFLTFSSSSLCGTLVSRVRGTIGSVKQYHRLFAKCRTTWLGRVSVNDWLSDKCRLSRRLWFEGPVWKKI